MISKINLFCSMLKGTKITPQISNTVKNSYKSAKNIFGEIFPRLDKDYDKLVVSKQEVKPSKSNFDWDAIEKMPTFKM